MSVEFTKIEGDIYEKLEGKIRFGLDGTTKTLYWVGNERGFGGSHLRKRYTLQWKVDDKAIM